MLSDIAEWLRESYEDHQKLSGIIYMHNIHRERMEGSALRNLKMFREICGDDPLKNVILVTSFWGNVDRVQGELRERELCVDDRFWGAMISRGSRVQRFTDDRNSALNIVSSLVAKKPVALGIQQELVDEQKRLVDTSAGKVVNEELLRLEKKYQVEHEKLQQELEALKARDDVLQQILEDERRKMELQLEKVHRQQEQLKDERRADYRRMENRFANMRSFDMHSDTQPANIVRSRSMQGGLPSLVSASSAYASSSNGADKAQPPSETEIEVDLDWLISRIRANEGKIKPDEKIVVELKITEAKKQRNKLHSKKLGRILLSSLRVALPMTTLALLGIPIHLPIPVNQIKKEE